MHDNKYIKNKIKIYNVKINTNFHDNKIAQDNEFCVCLSVILLDSVDIVDKKYYPHIKIFLEEYKYAVKKKKIINAINEELNLDGSNNDESDKDQDYISDDFLIVMDLIVYD